MRRLGILGLAALLPLLLAAPAFARGGRYGGPGQASPPPTEDAGEAEPASPEPTTLEPLCPQPTDGGTTTAPPTTTTTLPGDSTRTRPGRTAKKAPGATQWTRWYSTHRERYEDLRARHLFTRSSPIFAVGDAVGGTVQPPPNLSSDQRREILRALQAVLQPGADHWIHTEAAALVALGKVAERPVDLQPHFALLAPDSTAQEYLKESAILGLANLRRDAEKDRFSAVFLDRVRENLLRVLGSDDYRPKTRGHAALALALLADQPSRRNGEGEKWTARTLFQAWTETALPEETQVGILVGLQRLDPRAVGTTARLVLAGCATLGDAWPSHPSGLVRAHALLALARVGEARDAASVTEILGRTKGEQALVIEAAPMAAAILGERLPETRGVLASKLAEVLPSCREPGTRRLIVLALGRLLAAEARTGDEYLLADRKVGDLLLQTLADGGQEERPFAGIALGLVVRGIGREVPTAAWNEFWRTAVTALRRAFEHEKGDVATRAAYAVGLGLARDGNSSARLLTVLEDEDEAPETRAYAAVALGLLGDARKEASEAMQHALRDPRSDVLQSSAATALGLLGDGDRRARARLLETLVTAMRRATLPYVKGQIAITLGRIGDGRAIPALVHVLQDAQEPHLNRAIACAALGLLGERGLHSTFAPVRWDAMYLSSSALVYDVLDVL